MLTSKQRAILRGKANTMDPVFIVGKGEIDETMIQGVKDCLDARELIKLKVLENSMYNAREASHQAGRGHRRRLRAGHRLQVRALPAEEKGQRLRRPAESEMKILLLRRHVRPAPLRPPEQPAGRRPSRVRPD